MNAQSRTHSIGACRRMEGVNTNPKDGPAARYGYRASIAGSAAARPLRRACALWWVLVRRNGMHCQRGSARGPRGPQGPLSISPAIPVAGLTLATPHGGHEATAMRCARW